MIAPGKCSSEMMDQMLSSTPYVTNLYKEKHLDVSDM